MVEDVNSWGAHAAVLPTIVRAYIESAGGRISRAFLGALPTADEQIQHLLAEYKEVVQQRDSLASQMGSLKLYYREQAPSLQLTARTLIESFNKDFEGRYNPLSSQLESYSVFKQRSRLREDIPGEQKVIGFLLDSHPLGGLASGDPLLASLKSLEEEWDVLPEAARYAQDWDFGPYQVAFEKEIGKSTSGRS